MKVRVLILGLGPIGLGITKNLCLHGHVVFAHDRNRDKVAVATSLGAHGIQSLEDIADELDAVFVALNNGSQAMDVLFTGNNLVSRLAPGTLVLLGTTTTPDIASELSTRSASQKLLFVECPLSGGAKGAQNASLTLIVSASSEAFTRAQPILGAISAHIKYLGAEIGHASLMKMVNQMVVAINLCGAAEIMAFAIAAGFDRVQVFDILSHCAADSWVWQDRVSRFVAGEDAVKSKVSTLHKDIEIIADETSEGLRNLPIFSRARDFVQSAINEGLGDEDDISLVNFAARRWLSKQESWIG